MIVVGCSEQSSDLSTTAGPKKIISLDYCADQFVLALVDRENILALSPQATAPFSYLREAAAGIKTVRASAEDILVLKPDIVVRTYGGGPNATTFFERAGIDVVQIGYASTLDDVSDITRDTARQLKAVGRGELPIADMEKRLKAIPPSSGNLKALYLTSKGAVAGRQTIIGDIMERAGVANFLPQSGWESLPLEHLVYEKPDLIAAGFFESSDFVTDRWTPSRHPVAQRLLSDTPVVLIPGSWTSCGAWPLINAVEAIADAREL